MRFLNEPFANVWRQATPDRLLRWSLGVVYLWFGGLKLVSMSPVTELVRGAYPPLATIPLFCLLTVFEIGLGGLFFVARYKHRAGRSLVTFNATCCRQSRL